MSGGRYNDKNCNNNDVILMAVGIFLLCSASACSGQAVFDVMKYGAKADSKHDDSTAFIQAWRAACDSSDGPVTVSIPPGKYMAGEVVFAGPCGPGPITIQIQGNVTANDDPSVYTLGAWFMIQHVSNVIVTGGGTIDVKGANLWQYADGSTPMSVSMVMEMVSFGKLNNLYFVNSMGFHTKVTDSHDVVIDKLTITAPGNSPNTDGIHLSNATNVNVTNTVIGTGDDCVSIGHGAVNVLVSGVICGPGHGISVGSLGKRDNELNVKGVTVINCNISNTENGARIKTYSETPELEATGITFQNITMNQVANPIIIDQHYHSSKKKGSNVKISDVHFINIKGTTVTPAAIQLDCSATHPCEAVELSNINLQPVGEAKSLTATCANAQTNVKGMMNPAAPQCS